MKTEELDCVLQRELECAESFVTLLKCEQNALINGDIEALTQLNTEKTVLVHRLMQLHEQRNQLQATCSSLVEPVERNSEPLPTQIFTISVAQKCQTLLQSAKQLNHTNQNILAQWLRQTRQSLQALRSAVGQAELYSPKGLTI